METKTPLDTLLSIGASFDWITPSWMILQDFLNRPAAHFGIDTTGGFDRGDVRRILRKSGVRSWGYVYNVVGDLIMLSVPKAQAQAAYDALVLAGVPVLYSPIGAATPADEAPRPTVALGNSFRAGEMRLVKAPSIWGLLGKVLRR